MAQFFGLVPLNAANFESGAATDGQVLTADGAGGAAFEDAAGGGGAVTSEIPVAGAMLVSGAGMSAVNGVYLPDGTIGGRTRYRKDAENTIWSSGLYGMWQIGNQDFAYYYAPVYVETPDLVEEWINNSTAPVPTVTAISVYPSGFFLGADGAGGTRWAEPASAWNINASGGREIPGGAVASGIGSVAEGKGTALGDYSHVMGGIYGVARHGGSYAASTPSSDYGFGQYSRHLYLGETQGTTPTELFINGVERLEITQDSVVAFRMLVAAMGQEQIGVWTNKAAGYELIGLARHFAGVTTLVGTVTKTVLGEDDASWDINVVVDNTTKTLNVVAQGGASTRVRWHVVAFLSEVSVH